MFLHSLVGWWKQPVIFDIIVRWCSCILRSVAESCLWFSISIFIDVPAFSGRSLRVAYDLAFHLLWCSCIPWSVDESSLWFSISFPADVLAFSGRSLRVAYDVRCHFLWIFLHSPVGRWELPMMFDFVPAFSSRVVKAACDFRFHFLMMFLHSPVGRWELRTIFDFIVGWCSCIIRSVAETCLWFSISFLVDFPAFAGRLVKSLVLTHFYSRCLSDASSASSSQKLFEWLPNASQMAPNCI